MTFKTGNWGKEAQERSRRRLFYFRNYQKELRLKVIEKFGGKCIRCGFSDWRALQIDHINGGGLKERIKHRKAGGGDGFNRRILKDTSNKYQLLCANCNWIKRFENKETRKGVKTNV